MSEFSRREMLSAAAAGGMAAAAMSTDGLAEGQPPFGPTPPVLAGAQLPSFRFQLGAVGVTGDTEDRDEELAVYGVRAIGLKTDEDCTDLGRRGGVRLTNT